MTDADTYRFEALLVMRLRGNIRQPDPDETPLSDPEVFELIRCVYGLECQPASEKGRAMICIGIDPGLTGAIAAIDTAGDRVVIRDIPTVEVIGGGAVRRRIDGRGLVDLLRLLAPARDGDPLVTVEHVHAIAGKERRQGGMQQMASLMRSVGAIEAILDALRWRADYIRPQAWKKVYRLGRLDDNETDAAMKARALDMARRLYPAAQDALRRAKDHNRGESLLIAHYGRMHHE